MFIQAISLIAVFLAPLVSGFAYKVPCDFPLIPGAVFMGLPSKSDDSKPIAVSRNGVPLTSGSLYSYGEVLTISLADAPSEYLIEAQGVTIPNGSCSGRRLTYQSFNVTMPASGSTTVKFRGAWTTSRTMPVSVVSDFVLVPSAI